MVKRMTLGLGAGDEIRVVRSSTVPTPSGLKTLPQPPPTPHPQINLRKERKVEGEKEKEGGREGGN